MIVNRIGAIGVFAAAILMALVAMAPGNVVAQDDVATVPMNVIVAQCPGASPCGDDGTALAAEGVEVQAYSLDDGSVVASCISGEIEGGSCVLEIPTGTPVLVTLDLEDLEEQELVQLTDGPTNLVFEPGAEAEPFTFYVSAAETAGPQTTTFDVSVLTCVTGTFPCVEDGSVEGVGGIEVTAYDAETGMYLAACTTGTGIDTEIEGTCTMEVDTDASFDLDLNEDTLPDGFVLLSTLEYTDLTPVAEMPTFFVGEADAAVEDETDADTSAPAADAADATAETDGVVALPSTGSGTRSSVHMGPIAFGTVITGLVAAGIAIRRRTI